MIFGLVRFSQARPYGNSKGNCCNRKNVPPHFPFKFLEMIFRNVRRMWSCRIITKKEHNSFRQVARSSIINRFSQLFHGSRVVCETVWHKLCINDALIIMKKNREYRLSSRSNDFGFFCPFSLVRTSF